MFKPCPNCGMMWHFSCHDQSCLDAICSQCEYDDEWGAPLQVSEYAKLEPLGIRKKDDLKK